MSALPPLEGKRALVRSMFDRIAPRYDLLNRLLTGGLDQRWRRIALSAARTGPGDSVLDLACGTGDLSEQASSLGAQVVGIDFAREMLRGAVARGIPAGFVQGDAEALPFSPNRFDVVSCGFALRNFSSLDLALGEIARVLRPGGRIALLDVDRPRGRLLAAAHSFHFDHVVPWIGARLSDKDAYRYLPESTVYLPNADELHAMLSKHGLSHIERRSIFLGTAQLWLGTKAEA